MRLAYCGTLGHSYDISCVIEAIRKLDWEHRNRFQFVVMGSGPKMQEFSEKAKGLPVIFTGRISYPEMVWVLKHCDIAVNPISKRAAQSVINKHMDYAMAGLPVINTQECEEYRDLLAQYKAGINCECENVNDIVNALKLLIDDVKLRALMGRNSLKLGIERFDRAISYNEILELFK